MVSTVPILQLALSGREIEIATGLAADDRIIVTPLDGVADGDKVRIAVARKFIDDFGLSAECGWGRTEPGRLPGLLTGHRVAAEAF